MKDDALQMCLLFDFYGSILTERQQEVFDLYYNEDLSLAEIAEHAEITRQGVRDALARARTILLNMEEKLGLVRRFRENSKTLERIRTLVEEMLYINSRRFHSPDFDKRLNEILELAVES
ncbi:MAG TPA: YlxM family DNA-binding protein [Clostridiales bacterium]|jgi:predicted DNA-binding protein YlxM (UPF0122 family)|nr:YlxM family DNA-binding protein [Clostridiales bacterium]